MILLATLSDLITEGIELYLLPIALAGILAFSQTYNKIKMNVPIRIIVIIVLIILSIFLVPLDTIYVDTPINESENFISNTFADLIFYEATTNCSLSGTLILGDFTAEVINGKYKLFMEDYKTVNTKEVILFGETSSCFGGNSNLPFYSEWDSENILDYSEYTFEIEFNPRWPTTPQAMQGFIRPNEVEERYSKIDIDENKSDMENLEKIFAKGYMNYVSDKGRFGEEIEFTSQNRNREQIINEISERTGLSIEDINLNLEFEVEEEDELGEEDEEESEEDGEDEDSEEDKGKGNNRE